MNTNTVNKESLQELNDLRRKTKSRATLGAVLGIILSLIFLFIGLPFLIILPVIGAFVLIIRPYMEFQSKYKELFVRSSLEEVFSNLNYQPDNGIPEDVIRNTKMMRMGNRYHANDYIEADYNGVHFRQSDVCIDEESRDSDGHSHTETLFKGQWMVFDFNKEFKANLQVVQKGFRSSKRKRFFGNEEEKYKKVEMENAEFNENFRVFAQNEHDAFYILTPQMMERIKRVSENIDGKFIFCFVGNVLHIGINTNKDSFEPKLMKEIDTETEKQRISKDISLITSFVNELKLDSRLFKA